MGISNKEQKITMVTGKGGVGKSAVAAAIAQKFASEGLKTLLVELGEHSYYEHVYGKKISYQPTEISTNFSISVWGGQACLREYVWYFIRVQKIVDLFFENKVMKTFINAAPALKELAILGKVTSGRRGWGPPLDFDRIVVDGFSTGHFVALLKAPLGMSELIEFGPMGEQSRSISKVLSEVDACEFVIVTLPEELPVTETVDLARDIEIITKQKAQVICNKVYSPEISNEQMDSANASEFLDYIKANILRQQKQVQNLKINFSLIKILPLIFSAVGKKVISGLEEKL